jgi:Tfp pilus assembly pilus retraction ATPase PilT
MRDDDSRGIDGKGRDRLVPADGRRNELDHTGRPMGKRLSELMFTDLYISHTGEVLIKGAMDDERPVKVADDFAIADLHDILQILLREQDRHADTGEFRVEYDNINYRVTVMEDIDETWFTLRRPMSEIPRLSKLGAFNAPIMRFMGWLGRQTSPGLVLIAGRTGHGKTTTAYSLLREYLKSYGDIAVTIEDPPEMRFKEGDFPFGKCFQLTLKPGQTFGQRLVQSLRMSPKYIFIGELRRGNDASEALRHAGSGHLILTTIHAGNVIEAVNSFIKLASSEGVSEGFVRDLFAQSISAIIHQEIKTEKTGSRFVKKLKLETLFFSADDHAARSLIREGKTSQLNTMIAQQASLMAKNEDPTDYLGKNAIANKDGRR